MIHAITYLKDNIRKDDVFVELGGSKHQIRSRFLYVLFDNYVPTDISLSSMTEYSGLYDEIEIACDAQGLPLKDDVVHVIFTHTFLEDPLNPDMVIKEIHRVLEKRVLLLIQTRRIEDGGNGLESNELKNGEIYRLEKRNYVP